MSLINKLNNIITKGKIEAEKKLQKIDILIHGLHP